MRTIAAPDLLTLWERGASRHPLDRGALLCGYARPDLAPEAIADLRLGEVTSSVLRLRAGWFDEQIRAHVDCASCGVRLQLRVSVFDLLQPVDPALPDSVSAGGGRYRLPTLRDLAAVATTRDVARAALLLLARCRLESAGIDPAAEASVDVIEDALEAADPYADLTLVVHCEACGQNGIVQLDAVALLWDEIEVYARDLLATVDRLARAYGWTEGEILALSPERRASYLSMVEA